MRTRWSLITASLVFMGLGIPAAADTVSFSFSASASSQVVETPGEISIPFPQNAAGTMPPFGPCQVVLASEGASLTFTLATGDSFTATSTTEPNTLTTHMTLGTITSGTGIFANATGTFQISETEGAAVNLNVPFTFTGTGTITAPAVVGGVAVLPSSLQLQTPQGTSVSSNLILKNQGISAAAFTASAVMTSGANWLSVTPGSGSATAGQPSSVQVTANTAGLELGVYQGQVDMNVGGVSVIVPVVLIVGSQGGQLQLSETGESFTAAIGGPVPASQTLQVQNTGVGNLTGLTATTTVTNSGPNWLHASIAAGFASQTAAQVTVSVDPTSLAVGTYYGQVNFNLPSAFNSPQSVTVQLVVNAGPPPTFTPAGVQFHISDIVPAGTIQGYAFGNYGPAPPPVMVHMNNPGFTPIPFTAVLDAASTSAGATWFAFAPSSGTIPPGGTTLLTVSVIPGCFSNNPDCAGGVFISAPAVLVVNFPTINYSYTLRTWLFTDLTDYSPYGPYARPKIPEEGATPAAASSAVCIPYLLRGGFTSIPLNFQTTVGQPTPLEAQIFDDCANALNSGSVVATFSSGDASFPLTAQGSGVWTGTWTPQTASKNVTISLVGASQAGVSGALTLPGSVAASTSTPIIGTNRVVDAAALIPVAAPGSIIAIDGLNFGGEQVASSTPLPDLLGTTQVFVGGQAVPLFFTSSKQIDAIVPYGIAPGSVQQVVVQTGNALTQPANLPIATAEPGVFTLNGSGSGPGTILGQKPGGLSELNSTSNPATAGDRLLIYCAGLGMTSPAVTAGTAAPTPGPSATNAVTATVGTQNAQVQFAELVPGFVGLYQVSLTVPPGVTPGPSVPVVITAAGVPSPPVTVAIQ